MTNTNPLRELAKSPYWQTVYSRSKEMGSVSLFNNQSDFTPVQISFLQWLEVYHSLEIDLGMKKPYLSREVIDDEIRCDAYLHWKTFIQGKDEKEIAKLSNSNEYSDGAVIFKTKRKK